MIFSKVRVINLGVKVLIGFTDVSKLPGGPFILKLTPKTPSPTFLPTNISPINGIEEIYAIGPAISLLMSGYIEKDKLISLRGTLVPATTINKTIATIPLLGKILIGDKTGEGVFGVSFKIKGPKGKLKTTVNPIKTLTPRFITRTLEKLKKN